MTSLSDSDNETVLSPKTKQKAALRCDRAEQQRLEQIQAESAAYYAYKLDEPDLPTTTTTAKPNWHGRRHLLSIDKQPEKNMDFKVLTLAEIRERRERERLAAVAPTLDASQPPTEDAGQTTDSSYEQNMTFVMPTEKPSEEEQRLASSSGKRKLGETELKQATGPVKLRRSLKRSTEVESRVDSTVSESNETGRRDEQLSDEQLSNELFNNKQLSEECPVDEYIRLDATSEDIIKDIDDFLV